MTLETGLKVVYEAMPWLPTVSASLVMPFGSAIDPQGLEGTANVLHEWLQRGAGDLDSRQHSDALEDLGVRRGGGSGRETSSLSLSFLESELDAALPLFASMVTAPRFDDDEFESARELALQELESLDDAPTQRLLDALVARFISSPQGRSAYGSASGLAALTPAGVRQAAARHLGAEGAVLALAGGSDWPSIERAVTAAFGSWRGTTAPIPSVTLGPIGTHHVPAESSQVQIGLAFPSAVPGTDEAVIYGLALGVLSGSMGSRLFTEVREKRGLVYSVSAFSRAMRGFGYTVGYAGTTPERAEETLTVFLAELQRLAEGVSEAELERARTGILSSLVMQGESSGATAGRLASDMFTLGRARTLDEIRARIEAVDLATLNDYLAANPLPEPTVVTLGPVPAAAMPIGSAVTTAVGSAEHA
ncbi:MAG TPA: pitrilysin family protein [Trueperaceae bacterium]|nr:pitrilysin family protein [Trueperaceae bacterium]